MPSSTFFHYTGSNNIAASCEFYTKLIGLEQVWDEPDHIDYRLVCEDQFSISFDSMQPSAIIGHSGPDGFSGWNVQPPPCSA